MIAVLSFFTIIFHSLISYGNFNRSNHIGGNNTYKHSVVSKIKPSCNQRDTKTAIDKRITIIVSYSAVECGCAQWFVKPFKNVKFSKDVTRFYLEPTNKNLINANNLWDGKHLPLTLKVTGRFSGEKEMPKTFSTKETPEKAKIFWYDKIKIVSKQS